MDRIDSLLQTLLDQRASRASTESLLGTLSLLQFELQKQAFPLTQEWGTSKVSVLLPLPSLGTTIAHPSNQDTSSQTEPDAKLINDQPKEAATQPLKNPAVKEVNAVVVPDTSVNDRLRNEKPILAEAMQGGPIKDLRKGISLNERYQLVRELFEGDEIRFDKTIRTINAFSILAEAQFWMEKEFYSKPGWPSQSPSAQLLDQLIKRRFS